ncbi:MAG: ribonuclease H [Pseudorhizobium sp.]
MTIDPVSSPLPQELHVFTDGSFDARSRSGGWGFVAFETGVPVHRDSGSAAGQSNNSLELLAVVQAISWLSTSRPGRATNLWTDSHHVVEGCQLWRAIWRNNGWKRIDPNSRARRRSIPDAALWQRLDLLLDQNPNVTVMWCKAHSGIAGNEDADMLARSRFEARNALAPITRSC